MSIQKWEDLGTDQGVKIARTRTNVIHMWYANWHACGRRLCGSVYCVYVFMLVLFVLSLLLPRTSLIYIMHFLENGENAVYIMRGDTEIPVTPRVILDSLADIEEVSLLSYCHVVCHVSCHVVCHVVLIAPMWLPLVAIVVIAAVVVVSLHYY